MPIYRFKQWDGAVVFEIEQLRFRDGVDPATVTFETGYADDAIRSFAVFDRLQGEVVIPPGVEYQICSASPPSAGWAGAHATGSPTPWTRTRR